MVTVNSHFLNAFQNSVLSAKSLSFISFCPVELFYYSTSLLLPLNFFLLLMPPLSVGFPGGLDDKKSACNEGDLGSIPGLGRSPGEGHGNPLQYSCLQNPHGQSSLVGCSPWGCKELDMTEQLNTWHIASICTLSLLPFFSHFAGKISFPMASSSVDMMTTPRFVVDFWPLQSIRKVYCTYPILDVSLA